MATKTSNHSGNGTDAVQRRLVESKLIPSYCMYILSFGGHSLKNGSQGDVDDLIFRNFVESHTATVMDNMCAAT